MCMRHPKCSSSMRTKRSLQSRWVPYNSRRFCPNLKDSTSPFPTSLLTRKRKAQKTTIEEFAENSHGNDGFAERSTTFAAHSLNQ